MTSRIFDTEEFELSDRTSVYNDSTLPKQISPKFMLISENQIGELATKVLLYIEIERLNSVNYFLQKENEDLKLAINQSSKSNSNQKLLEERLEILLVENKNLNNIILSLINDQSLKGRASPTRNLTNQTFGFSPDNSTLKRQLDEKTENIKLLSQSLQETQRKLSEVEKNNGILMNEVDRLNLLLNTTTQELNDLRADSYQMRLSRTSVKNENDNFSTALKDLQTQLGFWRDKALSSEKTNEMALELENSNRILQQQVMELDKVLQQKQRELEFMHKHILDLENSQTSKSKLEQINQVYSEEVQKLNMALQDKVLVIEELRSRLMKVEQELFQKKGIETMMSPLPQENEHLRQSLAQKEQELKNLAEHQRDFESKVALVVQENERANQIMSQQQKELDRSQGQLYELEKYKVLAIDLEGQNRALTKELDSLGHQHKELIQEVEALKQRKLELERDNSTAALKTQIVLRQQEIELLNSKVQAKDDEISELHRLVKDLGDKYQDYKELEAKVQFLVMEYEKQISVNQEKDKEIQRYILQIKQLEEQLVPLSDVEDKLAIIVKENESLNEIIGEKVANIERLTNRVRELEERAINFKEGELNSIKNENFRLQNEVVELKQNLSNENCKYSDLEKDFGEKINALIRENESLNDIIGKQIAEINALRTELDRLKVTLVEKDSKIQSICENNVNLSLKLEEERKQKGDAKHNNDDITDFTAKISLVAVENKRLNEELILKTLELDNLKKKLQDIEHQQLDSNQNALISVDDYQRQAHQLENCLLEISQLKEQLDTFRGQNSHSEEVKNRLALLVAENQRISGLLEEKTKESEVLQSKLQEMEEKQQTLESMASENSELKNFLREKSVELNILKKNFIEVEKKDTQIQDLLKKIVNLEEELRHISTQFYTRNHEFERAEQRIRELESMLGNAAAENERLTKLIHTKQIEMEHTKEKCDEMERVKASNTESQAQDSSLILENNRLRETIKEYQADIYDLEEKLNLLIAVNEKLQKFANEKAKGPTAVKKDILLE